MNPRNRKDVEHGLERKGFQKSDNDHKKYIYHRDTGEKTAVWTKISHGSGHREISPVNQRKMAKQCKLSNKDFEQLLDCPLSREAYQEKLDGEGTVGRWDGGTVGRSDGRTVGRSDGEVTVGRLDSRTVGR